MHPLQRGISAIFLGVAIVAIAVALTAGYFTFHLNLKKTKQISVNSFEDCAKIYPIMESYPEQCNTPDGKHFVKELSDEEKQKILPPVASPYVAVDETANWKTYISQKQGYSLKYPSDKLVVCSPGNEGLLLFEGTSQDDCAVGEGETFMGIIDSMEGTGDIETSSSPDCYTVNKELVTFAGVAAFKYSNTIKNDSGNCQMPSAYARNLKHIIFNKGSVFNIFYINRDEDLKNKILATFQFLK